MKANDAPVAKYAILTNMYNAKTTPSDKGANFFNVGIGSLQRELVSSRIKRLANLDFINHTKHTLNQVLAGGLSTSS